MPLDWDSYRRADGIIDLFKVYENQDKVNLRRHEDARRHFTFIESMQPIRSRQVAAAVVSMWMQQELGG
jgi:hypothetical protein